MTSISPETQSVSTDDLGSLVVQSWRGTTPEGNDVPYLPACSLGDGANGPEGTAKAIEQFGTRGWPEGAEPGDAEALAAFTSDEDAMASAAHVVPARQQPAPLTRARNSPGRVRWPGLWCGRGQPDRAVSTTDLASSWTRPRWSGPRNDSA